MSQLLFVGVLLAFAGLVFQKSVGIAPAVPSPPPTPRKPVVDQYGETKVTDDYRWLEDSHDAAVQAWSAAQNQRARAYLDAIPTRATLHEQLRKLFAAASPSYGALVYRRGLLFALKFQPPKEQPLLVTLKTADDLTSERVILDLNVLNPNGTTSIDWYVPSLDGRLVAVSLSEKGSEEGSLHVYETATGTEVGDLVPGVNGFTAGGSAAWNAAGTGFFYTRYPREGERPKEDLQFFQQIYFHELGRPTNSDHYALGKEFPRIAEIGLSTTEDGRYTLAAVANGDGGEFAHYLLSPSGRWTQLTRFSDKITRAVLGPDDALYLLSHRNAPHGKILRLPLATPDLVRAKTIVRETSPVIEQFLPTKTRLYVVDLIGGPSQIRAFDHKGREQTHVPIKSVSSVFGLLRTNGDELLFNNMTYLEPPAWYRFDPSTARVTRTALVTTSPVDFKDTEVIRAFVTSPDGTKVPLNILQRKGTRHDAQNPTLLTGYGGYGISMRPSFDMTRRLWLDAGGVWAIANLRGGREYGEEWHRAGNLTHKQNVFDDFAACARYLVDARYTHPDRLAIEGGSNGGLLMGAALTQHPDRFRAVVSHVGIYDMLRVELDPNGAFNVTEFGTVTNPEQFRALYAYSPYHHVRDGVGYPAILFLTGDNDGRVNPAQSRKMIARLQAATASDRPVLLRTSSSSGHGMGTRLSESIAQMADVYAFLFDHLAMTSGSSSTGSTHDGGRNDQADD